MAHNDQLPFVFGENSVSVASFTVKCLDGLPPAPVFIIDEDGDLILQVGSEAQGNQRKTSAFRVCSKTLSRSSPVMKKMLYGGFAESKPPGDQPWTVHLPEDNPEALEVLLNIIHSRFDRVTSKVINIDDLYNITILTDKYDLTRMLQPWVEKWRDGAGMNESSLTGSLSESKHLEKKLWITWDLGDLKNFELLVGRIASICEIDSNGKLTRLHMGKKKISTWFHNVTEPPDIQELIVNTRMRKIEDLLARMNMTVAGLIQWAPGELDCKQGISSCNATILGSIIRSLAKDGLWPIPDPSKFNKSVTYLLKLLKLLDISTSDRHWSCKEMVTLWKDNITTDIQPQLSDMHKRHCLEQAKKSGLNVYGD
ncbi:hypothetical protein F5X99DRAFT_370270 [Biscogniauxia marginata]|nr:hypothetical protein F5X99DRAFT_370270 [Biscogniauxia marginata]